MLNSREETKQNVQSVLLGKGPLIGFFSSHIYICVHGKSDTYGFD